MLQGKPCIRVATKHLNIKTLLIFTIFSFILWGTGYLIAFVLPFEDIYNSTRSITHKTDIANFSSMDVENLTLRIILNNSKSILINITGFFSLGITTVLNLLFNGFMHGHSIRYSLSCIGNETWVRILPHSFELIGLYLSGAVGFYNTSLLQKILSSRRIRFKHYLYISSFFTFVAFIIIIAAGIIEGEISAHL